jgi:hypothetical protein
MFDVLRGKQPDITAAQLAGVFVAGVPVIATLLRSFGVYDVNADEEKAMQDAVTWGGIVAGALFASDAGLRAARNHADARRHAAALAAPTEPHILPPELDADAETDGELSNAPLDAAELEDLVGPTSSSVPDAPEDI